MTPAASRAGATRPRPHKLYRPAWYLGAVWAVLLLAWLVWRYSPLLNAAGVVGVVFALLALLALWTDGRRSRGSRLALSLIPLAVAVISIRLFAGAMALIDGSTPAPMTDETQRSGEAVAPPPSASGAVGARP